MEVWKKRNQDRSATQEIFMVATATPVILLQRKSPRVDFFSHPRSNPIIKPITTNM